MNVTGLRGTLRGTLRISPERSESAKRMPWQGCSLRISPDQRSSATRMHWQGCSFDYHADLFASNDAHFSRPRKSAAKANTEPGKNGIIHAMNNRDKSALPLALAIVGGIAAGLRCDASEKVENSSQYTPRPAAYTVKTYTEGSDPFVP